MPSPNVARPQAVLGLLTVLGVLTACGGPDESPKGAGPIPVTVVTLTPQPVTLTRELPGRTTAFLVAEVRPQVTGIVARRLFTEGGLVKAGQPLYQLDDATYRADDHSAKANLARAQATLVTAQLNAERSANLVKIDAVSKQDDENAVAALRQAEADVAPPRRRPSAPAWPSATPASPRRSAAASASRRSPRARWSPPTRPTPLATVQQLDPIYVDLTQSSSELLRAAQGSWPPAR